MTIAKTLLLILVLPGCALTSKSEPLTPRFFSPEVEPADAAASSASGTLLKLGSVAGVADLRTELAYRSAAQELGYDAEVRWTEEPEVYVRRALARALFEERGLSQVLSGPAPTLDIEVLAFEERTVAPPAARVTVLARLHDDRTVRLLKRVTVDVPFPGSDPAPDVVVAAISKAMYAVVDQVASAVVAELGSTPTAAVRQP